MITLVVCESYWVLLMYLFIR